MKINFYGSSSVGRVRKINEDSFYIDSKFGDRGSIFLVCDGMGGHKAGEVASQYASVKTVEYFYSSSQKDILSKLNEAIKRVNIDIYNQSQKDSSKRGMGTTLVAGVIFEDTLYFANVGDSRAYIIRNNSIKKITKDHSWLEEKISEGLLSPEDARNNPNKNIITKCVGYDPDVEPNLGNIILKDGDRIILCSDGLWDELEDSEIKGIALSQTDLKKVVDLLIISAERKGGKDNITVLGIDYGKVRIKKIVMTKNNIFLSVVSAIAIFFVLSLIILYCFYHKSKKEIADLNIAIEELQVINDNNMETIKDLQSKNKELNNKLENLENENKELKKETETIRKNNFAELAENENLIFRRIFNLNEFIKSYGVIKKLFIDDDKFLFLISEDANRLYYIKYNRFNPIETISMIIQLNDNNGNIMFDDIIFDKNNIFALFGNEVYKNVDNGMSLDEGIIKVEKINELPEINTENELAKYIIIQNELFYFYFHESSNELQGISSNEINFINMSVNNNLNSGGSIELDESMQHCKFVNVNYDSSGKILYLLLTTEDASYLLSFNKSGNSFKHIKTVNIFKSDALPEKILISDLDTGKKIMVYFNDGSFYYYDENLELIKENILIKLEENVSSQIDNIFIDNSYLFILDNSNNIYSVSVEN